MIVIPNRVRVVVVMVSALALAGGLLTLAVVLAKPAQAQAETSTTNVRFPFNEVFFSCADAEGNQERVQIQGTLHTVVHNTIDENGVYHSEFHFNIQGQGVSDSGAKYVARNVFTVHENFSDEPPHNFTYRQTVKLIRQGSATPTDDRVANFYTHITINANGEVTSIVEKAEGECT